MVLWKRHGNLATEYYHIRSTVVAKGLCQQDRKMTVVKLLLLPPAFGMAMDFTKAFWESVQGFPGRAGNRDGRNHVHPHEKCPRYVSFP